jgi:phosphoribosylanthranilate isomerase
MPLKTLVKVGNITNLSDARYCAGMGVDMLGFNVIEGNPNYVPPSLFQDIRGWVSGPSIVAEVYGATPDTLSTILENYRPQLLECDPATFENLRSQTTLPFLISLADTELMTLPSQANVQYFIVNDTVPGDKLTSLHAPILFRVSSADKVAALIKSTYLKGFALTGSSETRPGFKDYEGLSEILEMLDE